ncbi:5-methylcytosine-specific restriction endonuclease McrA [Prauserella marina]|uniref:5-methylcytosine-specific restriction endonuclease McrA n=1 Tax=Prauserella marina TaxID=530584 RepID=A0A1G6I4F8_9PSEU|nr:HNH endonuclease [Prauserella marina]PWV85247.1 5-methylcytosine-specific restriction endonuclease McrA [Prauserella marina]SDC01449.1 5-methylcytosine-specific restriction endonuclease McrA [Prauserella marina]
MPDRQPSPHGVHARHPAGQALEALSVAPAVGAGLGGPFLGGPQPTGPPTRGGRITRTHGQWRSRDHGSSGPGWGKRRVLLLNATFEPLTALPLRRAIVLVVCGKAEVVHENPAGLRLHAATMTVDVPSVIRLSTYVRVPYRAQVPLTRAGLMHRDHFRCAYCGVRAETIDHVVPRSRGGAHSWQNCVACCAKCNHRKADKLLSEIGWRLRVVPRAPHGPHWRLLAHSQETDPVWQQYLGAPAA